MDEMELKKQEADFKRLVRCNELVQAQHKRDRIRRQYLKRKYESVLGVKLADLPPLEFPKDNILKGFGTNRKD
jgi:hypothetical protein